MAAQCFASRRDRRPLNSIAAPSAPIEAEYPVKSTQRSVEPAATTFILTTRRPRWRLPPLLKALPVTNPRASLFKNFAI
jgi:hypothetical protein